MKNYAIAGLLFQIGAVFSLPISPEVLVGNAEFHLEGRELSIQVSEQSQINWNDFSIDAGERVSFIQPSELSLVVNRVIGDQQSQILGQLKANGQVILINQNGVLFGNEARIDTQSFIASTLDLQGDCFAKNKIFKGASTAPILNFGSIAARSVALISADIDNRGTLEGLDSVALIGSTYHAAWDCQFGQPGSRIAQSGRMASPGGSVHLMADEIFVFGTSEITTSSPHSGGEILIGAGLQGKDPSFTNAQLIWVEEGSRFFADALEQGDGGRVILFSDQMTDFSGHISAQGGKEGGNGGLAEVSGGYLAYKGLADLRSPLEKAGTLLLDPTNVTIVLGAAVTTSAPGAAPFPLTCSANVPLPFTHNTPLVLASTIGVGTILAQLGVGSVVIDTTVGGAPGNITSMGGADLIYTSANDLVLNAPATGLVQILANVQNGGTGRVIINSLGPTVDINSAANTQGVSFGSQNGLTQICAPNAIVNVVGGNGGSFQGQVGFYTPDLGMSTGPISIQCASLNVITGLGGFSGAQVGHGRINFAPATIAADATIDVNANGDISIITQGIANHGRIGHGSLAVTVPGGILRGNITVISANGNLLLQGTATAISLCNAIGHGNGLNGIAPALLAGDILVRVPGAAPNGNITMQWLGGGGSVMLIGHGIATAALDGDIEVCCRRDLTMFENGLGIVAIGHDIFVGIPAYTGSNLVTVGRDILLTGGNGVGIGGGLLIGFASAGGVALPFVLTTQIACGQDFRVMNGGASLVIGNINPTCIVGSLTTTFLIAGRDVILNTPINNGYGIGACGNVAVAAGRHFTATNGTGDLPGAFSLNISSLNVPALSRTHIYAGGDILGTNGPGRRTILGGDGAPNHFVELKAGGDIQISSSYAGIGTGGLFIEADTLLGSGDMWRYVGGVLTEICGLPCTFFPINCLGLLTGIAAASSPPVFPDTRGAVRFVTAPFGTTPLTTPFLPVITSTSGPITIHSASRKVNGMAQDLRIGTVLNLDDVNITTTSGNIQIFGTQIPGQCQGCPNPILGPCRSPNSFYNVTLNQALTPTGSVFISANNDLTLTSTGNIDTRGAPPVGPGNLVTLVCDNQAPVRPFIGPGRFIMDSASFINTRTAQLRIHTALQGANIWGIGARLNNLIFGTDWTLGPLYVCTNQEAWCSYFCDLACPMSGVPFTISYKDCFPNGPDAEPPKIISQFLVDLHPYNEFPGWMARFFVYYSPQLDADQVENPDEPYMLRRRNLNVLKHPKSYTVPLNNELDHSFERDVPIR